MPVATFNTCKVFVSLCDLQNAAPTIDPNNPPKLYVSNDRGFLQGTNVVYPFSQSVSFDANGEATIEVIETQSTGEKLEFAITFPNGDSIESFRFPPSVVPDAKHANLSDVVNGTALLEDFMYQVGSEALASSVKTATPTYKLKEAEDYSESLGLLNTNYGALTTDQWAAIGSVPDRQAADTALSKAITINNQILAGFAQTIR